MGHATDRPELLLPKLLLGDEPAAPIRSGRRGWLDRIRTGWGRRSPEPPGPPPTANPPSPNKTAINLVSRTATPLLAVMARLPGLPPPPDPEALHNSIVTALRRFPAAARTAGIGPDQMRAAHFILCAAFDDVVRRTAWGQEPLWLEHSFTRTFYKSLEPGPSLITLLQHLLLEPEPETSPSAPQPSNPHHEVLELVSICLALGFDGRSALKGAVDIQLLRDTVHLAILAERGEPATALSPSWQGVPAPRPSLLAMIPVWVIASLAGALLAGLYVLLAVSLENNASRFHQHLVALLPDRPAVIAHPEPPASEGGLDASPSRLDDATAAAPPPSEPSTRADRLRNALAEDLSAGRIEFFTTKAGDGLRIAASVLFNRTGEALSAPGTALIQRLAAALDTEPGHIQVIGHTDGGFAPNLRFSSSLAFTEAQASAVARALINRLHASERVEIEGRADTEPLIVNGLPASREQNRRIEIMFAPVEAH